MLVPTREDERFAALSAKLAEAERERDEAKQSIGMAQSQAEAAKTKLRMIVSHATMGAITGEGMSVNDISVKISEMRNVLYADGKKHGAADAEAKLAEAERELERTKLHMSAWEDSARINKHRAEAAEARVAELEKALKPWSDFADALNEKVPDDIAVGIFADGAMRFGPSGGANVGHLRASRAALSATKEPKP